MDYKGSKRIFNTYNQKYIEIGYCIEEIEIEKLYSHCRKQYRR